jgi:hypothetical protein
MQRGSNLSDAASFLAGLEPRTAENKKAPVPFKGGLGAQKLNPFWLFCEKVTSGSTCFDPGAP